MPGPAPDPNALRRDRKDDKASWTTLPAAGRAGDAPHFPLPRPSAAERKQWALEWSRPQAVVWELDGMLDEVALYVRALVRAKEPDAPTNLLTEVRKMRDDLGLSQPGLLHRRWKIESEPTAAVKRTNDAHRITAKARFQVLTGEATG